MTFWLYLNVVVVELKRQIVELINRLRNDIKMFERYSSTPTLLQLQPYF